MDHLHDSLSEELKAGSSSCRVSQKSGKNQSLSRIRPITTGVIDVKYGSSHLRNYNTEQYVDSSVQANSRRLIRPHAPIIGRRRESKPQELHTAAQTAVDKSDKRNSGHNRNKKKTTGLSIAEKWNSLEHFSHNNLGRYLSDQDVSSLNNTIGGGIHFVNVNRMLSSDRQPGSNRLLENTSRGTDITSSTSTGFNSTVDFNTQSKQMNWNEEHTDGDDDKSRIFSKPRVPIETSDGKISSTASTAFAIPELPSGKQLIINILSTWLVMLISHFS